VVDNPKMHENCLSAAEASRTHIFVNWRSLEMCALGVQSLRDKCKKNSRGGRQKNMREQCEVRQENRERRTARESIGRIILQTDLN